MKKSDFWKIDTTALFLAVTTEPAGAQIFIDGEGEIHVIDGSLSHRGLPDDWLYFGRAEGDFVRDDWGISRGEDERFYVEGLEGSFDSAEEALRAAVAELGITAEQHDDLIDLIELNEDEN